MNLAMMDDDYRLKLQAISEIDAFHINHDFYQYARMRVQDFHVASNFGNSSKMMLLFGESGTGKTTLVKEYAKKFNEQTNHSSPVVLYISVPAKCSPKSLAERILLAFGDAAFDKGTLINMTLRVTSYIEKLQVSLIILDEFQHFINKDSKKVIYEVADWLKSVSNEIKCPILAVGLPETCRVIDENEQLERRVTGRVSLPTFPIGNHHEFDVFRRIIAYFADQLPFTGVEYLISDDIVRDIHQNTHGIIGRVSRLFYLSGMLALQSGDEEFQHKYLSAAIAELKKENEKRTIISI